MCVPDFGSLHSAANTSRVEFYRQEGYQTGVQVAKESEKSHFARLNDLMREAEKVAKGG